MTGEFGEVGEQDPRPPFDRELEILRTGKLAVVTQLIESSNLGFVVDSSHGEIGRAHV